MASLRLTRDDWIQAALDALARGGVAAVRVDVLAKELGITRGSFYWHFADRDALLVAALDVWERELTTAVIERLEQLASPRDRYDVILRLAYFGRRDRNRVEPALAADADHPLIAPVLRRVTEARMRFLTGVWTAIGLPEPEARRRALVAYGIFVGWLQLRRTSADIVPEIAADSADEPELVAHLTRLLLADLPE